MKNNHLNDVGEYCSNEYANASLTAIIGVEKKKTIGLKMPKIGIISILAKSRNEMKCHAFRVIPSASIL